MSKLILGVGFNSKGRHKAKINGIHTSAYRTWYSMLTRCYCPKVRARQPTYVGCSVDKRWHDFQHFSDWFYDNDYSNTGYHLDKDLLVVNNKVYGPETCCFVPRPLNNLLTNHASARGDLPQGVSWCEPSGRYRAVVNVDGKREHLGRFETEQEAHQVYKKAKEAYVKEKALEWQDRIADNVFQALMNWTLDS